MANATCSGTSVDPELIFLFVVVLHLLLFFEKLLTDFEASAEFLVARRQHLHQVEVLDTEVSEDFAAWPNVLRKVVVKQQGEGGFFLQLTV